MRRSVIGIMLLGAVSPPAADAASVEGTVAGHADPRAVVGAVQRLTRPLSWVSLPALPSDPVNALIRAANLHSAGLGFVVDHAAVIRQSRIPAHYAGRVAQVLEAVNACRLDLSRSQKLDCAGDTSDALAGVLRTGAPAFRDIDAWPSLYIDGDGGSKTYRHDYAVLIDRGGNDTYDNNAGGNLFDHRRGPRGSVAPLQGRDAIGCEVVQGNFPAPTATAHDCIALPQVAFLDYRAYGSSNDTYGVMKRPRQTDHNPPRDARGNPVPRRVDGDCTYGKLVRRIVLQGSGFEGNGLLMDVDGNDRYRGKTAAQGSGHVGGIGVQRDLGRGRDDYLAIRNSQGFALIGIIGVLQDDGGNDYYHTYMPPPIDRNAPFQTVGSGGVVDDLGNCDDLPRMVQGTALLGGVGLHLDHDGRDVYVGAPLGTQQFNDQVEFFHSSQGFGCAGGIGFLRDTGRDDDTYREGPRRTDGMSVQQVQTSCRPGAPGLSIFSDDGR